MVSMDWPGKRSPSSSVNSVGVENLMVQERIFPAVPSMRITESAFSSSLPMAGP